MQGIANYSNVNLALINAMYIATYHLYIYNKILITIVAICSYLYTVQIILVLQLAN